MNRATPIAVTTVAIGLAVSIVLFQGCKGSPEETSPATIANVEPVPGPLTVIDLPQINSEIGVTVNAAPKGLVATYNEGPWIRLTDESKRHLTYVLVSSEQHLTGVAASSIDEFEEVVLKQSDGKLTGKGDFETTSGVARWANAIYMEDGVETDELFVIAAHPNRDGQLFVSASCPPGIASPEERIAVIQEILSHLS